MTFYIVEHPRRGTLRDLEETDSGKVGRFSISGSRNDPETAMQFYSIEHALVALSKIDRADGCHIRRSTPDPAKRPPYDAWPVVWKP